MKKYVYKNRFYEAMISLFDTIGYSVKGLIGSNRDMCDLNKIKRIVIFKLDHAGDVLLATPAIKAIRNRLPSAYITLVVGPWGKGIVEGETYFSELICFSAYWHDRSQNRMINIREILQLIKILRRGNYDIFFDLRGDLFAIIIATLSSIPRRVGYGWMGGGFFLTDEINTSLEKHQVEILLDAVKAVGIESETSQIGMTLSKDDEEDVKGILEKEGWKDSLPGIGLHVGSGYPSKMWPVERYADLIGWIVKNLKMQIIVVGGTDDIEVSKKLEENLSFKPINIVGKTTFKQTAAIIKKCSVFIGNDSVPVHIAAAIGIPTMVIFSAANDWKRWRPYGDNVTIITKDLPCKGCELQRCDHMRCMQMITVDEIVDKVREIFNVK